jgi:hypothetical protein
LNRMIIYMDFEMLIFTQCRSVDIHQIVTTVVLFIIWAAPSVYDALAKEDSQCYCARQYWSKCNLRTCSRGMHNFGSDQIIVVSFTPTPSGIYPYFGAYGKPGLRWQIRWPHALSRPAVPMSSPHQVVFQLRTPYSAQIIALGEL